MQALAFAGNTSDAECDAVYAAVAHLLTDGTDEHVHVNHWVGETLAATSERAYATARAVAENVLHFPNTEPTPGEDVSHGVMATWVHANDGTDRRVCVTWMRDPRPTRWES